MLHKLTKEQIAIAFAIALILIITGAGGFAIARQLDGNGEDKTSSNLDKTFLQALLQNKITVIDYGTLAPFTHYNWSLDANGVRTIWGLSNGTWIPISLTQVSQPTPSATPTPNK